MVKGLQKNDDRFVKDMELNPEITVDELIDEFKKAGAFGAGRLGLAADILEKMFREEKLLKFLGLAGALIPAGIRRIISLLINDDLIELLNVHYWRSNVNQANVIVRVFQYILSDTAVDGNVYLESLTSKDS